MLYQNGRCVCLHIISETVFVGAEIYDVRIYDFHPSPSLFYSLLSRWDNAMQNSLCPPWILFKSICFRFSRPPMSRPGRRICCDPSQRRIMWHRLINPEHSNVTFGRIYLFSVILWSTSQAVPHLLPALFVFFPAIHPSIHLRPGMDRREWMKRGTIRGQWYNHNNKKRDRQNPFITCNVQVSGVCAIAYNHLCSLRIILWLSAMRKCETVTGPSTVKRYLSCPAPFPPRIIR